jgi:hypothetical protein
MTVRETAALCFGALFVLTYMHGKSWLGFRWRAWRAYRREKCEAANRLRRQQAEWYAKTFRKIVVEKGDSTTYFHRLTVQQVAAVTGEPIPEWATDYMEAYQMGYWS